MDDGLIERLEYSFNLVAPRGDKMIDRLYAELSSRDAELLSKFPANEAGQNKKVFEALVLVVENLRVIDRLADPLRRLGGRHVAFGIRPEHYTLIGNALVAVLTEMAGEYWDDQFTADWNEALEFVYGLLVEGQQMVSDAAA